MTRYGIPKSVVTLFSVNRDFRKDEVGNDGDSYLATGGAYNWRYDAMGGNDKILITGEPASFPNIYAVNLGAGDDFFFGKSERDVVLGGKGSDSLVGADGADKLFGQAGNDYLANGSSAVYNDEADIVNGGKGNDIYDLSGIATVYDNGGARNVYNLIQSSISIQPTSIDFHLSARSSGIMNIGGDADDIIFAREGNMLIFGNSTDGTAAYIKNYFDGGETSISAFTCDDGTVLGPIEMEKGSNEGFANLML